MLIEFSIYLVRTTYYIRVMYRVDEFVEMHSLSAFLFCKVQFFRKDSCCNTIHF